MFANLHLYEVILVILVIVIIFGGKRLPELGRGLGKGLRDFRSALAGKDDADPGHGQDQGSPSDSPGQAEPSPDKPDGPKA